MKKWCQAELDGNFGKKCPDYRAVKGQLKAVNPFRGLIPFMLPDEFDEAVTRIQMTDSIGQIKNLLNHENASYHWQLSNTQKEILMGFQEGYSKLEPKVVFQRSQLQAIVTKVRTIIFNWSVELEEKGILGKGLKFTDKEKESAVSINNYTIENFQGIAGNIVDSTISQNNQMNVYAKDFDSLVKVLTENKVTFSDIQELKHALDVDDVPTEPNRFGKNVSEWIGKMVGKAATGSWEVGVSTAGTLLAEAISKFYGF